MTTQMLTNRAGMRDAPAERGGRNLPMAAGGASSGTARRESTPVRELKNLMEAVVERENMLNAFRRVVGNKGAAGVDAMSVDELKPYLQTHWERIKEQLLEGSYQPQPVRRVEIPKPGGKGMRKLGVPTVVDRLIQQALHQVLNPLFDPDFSAHSYGFRSGRSAHQALCQAREHVASGRRWMVDLDLEKFFDRVHHDVLMSRVARKVGDKRVLCLIRRYLQAGIMEGGLVSQPTMGTPQGGPLSPLLSNILLDDLDKELERRGHRFCRYADDVNVYVASRRAGQRVLDSIEKFLTRRLHLRVNRQKSAVDRPWKRKFLGYSMTWHKRPRLKVAPSSEKAEDGAQESISTGPWTKPGQVYRGPDFDASRVGKLFPPIGSQRHFRRTGRMDTTQTSLDYLAAMEACVCKGKRFDAKRARRKTGLGISH